MLLVITRRANAQRSAGRQHANIPLDQGAKGGLRLEALRQGFIAQGGHDLVVRQRYLCRAHSFQRAWYQHANEDDYYEATHAPHTRLPLVPEALLAVVGRETLHRASSCVCVCVVVCVLHVRARLGGGGCVGRPAAFPRAAAKRPGPNTDGAGCASRSARPSKKPPSWTPSSCGEEESCTSRSAVWPWLLEKSTLMVSGPPCMRRRGSRPGYDSPGPRRRLPVMIVERVYTACVCCQKRHSRYKKSNDQAV